LTKSQILAEEPKVLFFPFFKPVLATVTAFGILFGIFSLAQNSLPGDILYSIKKMTEKGRAVFVSEEEKPVFQLKLANERLEDLTKAPVKNLAPTISEFQANISEAAKNLTKIAATTSDPVIIKKIVEETKKLEENKQKVTALGVVIEGEGTKEFDNALAKVAENLIEDLESRTLTEEKENILSEMKELTENGKHSEALEIYLINQ
jgi:ribosomal protein L10